MSNLPPPPPPPPPLGRERDGSGPARKEPSDKEIEAILAAAVTTFPERSENNLWRKTKILALAAIATALAISGAWIVSPRYSYRIEGIDDSGFVEEINSIGSEGWELVFARRALNGDTAGYEAIFKKRRFGF